MSIISRAKARHERKEKEKPTDRRADGAFGRGLRADPVRRVYGTMVYQLADRTDGAQAKQAEPAKTLALGSGEMEGESRERVQMGGKLCDVLTRTYLLADGTRAQAITASPAAYIERMKQEGWQAQLVTGFAIGETDAVYARSGENAMLCARDGETVYMIIAQADEQTLYALGVDAETK